LIKYTKRAIKKQEKKLMAIIFIFFPLYQYKEEMLNRVQHDKNEDPF